MMWFRRGNEGLCYTLMHCEYNQLTFDTKFGPLDVKKQSNLK